MFSLNLGYKDAASRAKHKANPVRAKTTPGPTVIPKDHSHPAQKAESESEDSLRELWMSIAEKVWCTPNAPGMNAHIEWEKVYRRLEKVMTI